MPHANPASPAADGKLDPASLADKIDALAEKAQLGSQVSFDGPANNLIVWEDCDNRVCFMAHSDGTDTERDVSRAALIVELVNARETLTRALRDAERMRKALGRIASCDLLEVERYYERTWCIPETGNEYTSREPVFKRSSYQNAEEFQAIARQALGDTQ